MITQSAPRMLATLPPRAETYSQGGRAGDVSTVQDGFHLYFHPPSKETPQGVTPEHLFGAAWAACFNGAVTHAAKEFGHSGNGITVTARVQLHAESQQPFSVELLVRMPGIDEEYAQPILARAHATCAYSKATKGNVSVKITLV